MILRCMWCNLPCGEIKADQSTVLELVSKHDDGKSHTAYLSLDQIQYSQRGTVFTCGDDCSSEVARIDEDGNLLVVSRHHGKWHQNRLSIGYLLQISRCITFNGVIGQIEAEEAVLIKRMVDQLSFSQTVKDALRLLVS